MLELVSVFIFQSASMLKKIFQTIILNSFSGFPGRLGWVLRRHLYSPFFGQMSSGVTIKPLVEFVNCAGISLAASAVIERNSRLRCLGSKSQIQLGQNVTLDQGVDVRTHWTGQIVVGDRTYIGPYTCLSGDSITIGQDCLISSHVGIYANNHCFEDVQTPIRTQGNSYKGIVIEDDCWLGTGVKILDGVTLGRGSVIAAGAVVTKTVPPYAVMAGVPARLLRYRTAEELTQAKTQSSDLNCLAVS